MASLISCVVLVRFRKGKEEGDARSTGAGIERSSQVPEGRQCGSC